MSEVPIVLNEDEAWDIIETWEKTGYWATLGLEGFRGLTVTHMVQEGLFGEIIHAEGGYIHDLRLVKYDPEREPWRLQHSVDRNGNLYPDHPMSAIMPQLGINHGDRFDYLVSMSSGSGMLNEYAAHYYGKKHPFASAEMKQGDYNATLLKTVDGKLVTLNFDTNTPHPRGQYRLQGSKGVYWSDRYVSTENSKMYLEGKSPAEHQWESAGKYLKKYEHPILKNYNPEPRQSIRGHGGAESTTPIVWHRLIQAIRNDQLPDWDVYDSVTSSAISAFTERSVADPMTPVDLPDFTRGKWKKRSPWILR